VSLQSFPEDENLFLDNEACSLRKEQAFLFGKKGVKDLDTLFNIVTILSHEADWFVLFVRSKHEFVVSRERSSSVELALNY
jgi:hypothetical protein